MKAMTAPRLARPICRDRKPIFLDHKQVYFSNFCSRFCILYISSCKLERKVNISKTVFLLIIFDVFVLLPFLGPVHGDEIIKSQMKSFLRSLLNEMFVLQTSQDA